MRRRISRFPPPWTIEELNDACFVVGDSNVVEKISRALQER
jgi:hypothetical protein